MFSGFEMDYAWVVAKLGNESNCKLDVGVSLGSKEEWAD